MRLRIVLMMLCLFPGALSADTDAALAVLPLPPVGTPMVLHLGAPEDMQETLTQVHASQAAFTAIARALPSAISGHAAVLSQNQSDHGIDIFGTRNVILMQSGLGTSLVMDMAPGQGAGLGAALERAFGYLPQDGGSWARMEDPAPLPDLFSGGMPAPSHLQIDGDRVIQSSSPQALAPRAPPEAVTRLMDALERALPPQAVAVQTTVFVNLPDGVGLPVRMLLVADVTTGPEDGVIILGDPVNPAEVSDFIASANGSLVEGEEMDILLVDGTIHAAGTLAPRNPDHPPWRNPLMERIVAGLADGSFWRAGTIDAAVDEAQEEE